MSLLSLRISQLFHSRLCRRSGWAACGKDDMGKILKKVMENWEEVTLVVESIVFLMVAFGCGA